MSLQDRAAQIIARLSKKKARTETEEAELQHWLAIRAGETPPEGWEYSTRTRKFGKKEPR